MVHVAQTGFAADGVGSGGDGLGQFKLGAVPTVNARHGRTQLRHGQVLHAPDLEHFVVVGLQGRQGLLLHKLAAGPVPLEHQGRSVTGHQVALSVNDKRTGVVGVGDRQVLVHHKVAAVPAVQGRRGGGVVGHHEVARAVDFESLCCLHRCRCFVEAGGVVGAHINGHRLNGQCLRAHRARNPTAAQHASAQCVVAQGLRGQCVTPARGGGLGDIKPSGAIEAHLHLIASGQQHIGAGDGECGVAGHKVARCAGVVVDGGDGGGGVYRDAVSRGVGTRVARCIQQTGGVVVHTVLLQ